MALFFQPVAAEKKTFKQRQSGASIQNKRAAETKKIKKSLKMSKKLELLTWKKKFEKKLPDNKIVN